MTISSLSGNKPLGSLRLSLKKSFLYRSQAVFYGRLSLYGLYLLLWLLALFNAERIFPHTKLDLALILCAILYILLCYQYKSHKSLGRWLHFVTLTLDVVLHLWFTRTSLYLLSPLMAIHPFLSAAFLLLFHNPMLLIVPLSTLPLATLLCFKAQGAAPTSSMLEALLIYGGLDILASIFYSSGPQQRTPTPPVNGGFRKKAQRACYHQRTQTKLAENFMMGWAPNSLAS